MLSKYNLTVRILFYFGLLSLLFIWLGKQSYVYQITREDGIVENLTAIFYLLGFIFGLRAIFKNKQLLFPIIWTILCFFFLGEETSWFQRIFNYSVPAVENVNAQNEFNLHNLELFKGDKLFVDGQINKMGMINFLKSTQNLFRLGFFGYFVGLPVLLFIPRIKRFLLKKGFPKTDFKFILVILIVFGLSFILAIYAPFDRKMAFAETREMLYAFFIFVYILFFIWLRNRQKQSNN